MSFINLEIDCFEYNVYLLLLAVLLFAKFHLICLQWDNSTMEFLLYPFKILLLMQAKFHILQELLGRLHATVANSKRSEAYKLLMDELNEERQKARCMMKRMFNRSFGATFLTDKGQESAFAYHIHQYADVYTSKPENFLFCSPERWLCAPFDIKIMPHHLKVCLNPL